jgi:copper chaperone
MSGARTVIVAVEGMTCEGCANAVKRIVQRADPAAEVDVSLAGKRVEAKTTASADVLAQAISNAGYPAKAA